MRFSSVKPEIVSVLLSSAFRAERSSTFSQLSFKYILTNIFRVLTFNFVMIVFDNAKSEILKLYRLNQ